MSGVYTLVVIERKDHLGDKKMYLNTNNVENNGEVSDYTKQFYNTSLSPSDNRAVANTEVTQDSEARYKVANTSRIGGCDVRNFTTTSSQSTSMDRIPHRLSRRQ